MPTYTYFCDQCNKTWDAVNKIDNRKSPENEPCPKCNSSGGVQQVITAPMVSATMESARGIRRLNSSAFAEKLNMIHQNTPGSNLSSTSTIVDVK